MREEFLDVGFAGQLLDPRAFVYLVVVLAVLFIAKLSFGWVAPYHLNEQLTKADNKAVAIAFAGYLLGVGLILVSVLSGDTVTVDGRSEAAAYVADVVATVLWCVGGIILLHIARLVNDALMFHRFKNVNELVDDKNVGMGAAEAGSYVGSGLIVYASLSGESDGFFDGAVSAAVAFVVGQILFIVFGLLYQAVTRFDVHEQLEHDNAAAGVSAGLNLVAIGILLSGYIQISDSVVGMGVWFVLAAFLLFTSRYLVDKLILPGELLDEEISRDKNWGAALVEGTAAISIALIVNACFL